MREEVMKTILRVLPSPSLLHVAVDEIMLYYTVQHNYRMMKEKENLLEALFTFNEKKIWRVSIFIKAIVKIKMPTTLQILGIEISCDGRVKKRNELISNIWRK